MPGEDGDGIHTTGGQVDEMTMALIDAAFDRSEECQDIIGVSLFILGKKRPALVLSSCNSYLKKHSKLAQGHRIVILQCMEKIIKEKLDSIDKGLAESIVKQAAHELTQSKDVVPDWQTAASGVLVAIGMKYCNEVMEQMLANFKPGVLPHFFVVQTIANLSTANVYGMVPHLTVVLGTLLPMLGMAKQDNMKWVFSSAISKFSEAIIEYIANIDKAPDPTVKKEMFSSEIFAAYDVIFNVWLQSKEVKLRLAIVEALGHMTHLMTRDKLEEQLPRILAGIVGLYKRHSEPFHVTQGLCSVLDAVCVEGSTILDPHWEHVTNALFPQVFAPTDINNPLSIKNHNEVLRCFAVLARSFSGKLIGLLIPKLESNNEKIRIGILTIFKHLINAAASAMEDKKELIVSGLKGVCNEQNNKVKKVFAQVIIAMGHHGYMELEGGTQMIEFIVSQCSLPDDLPGKKNPDPDYVTNKALRHMCDNVLQLLTNTVEEMENVLWPYLLELLVPEKYTESAGVVCRCLGTIANKKRSENTEDYSIDYEVQANIPKPTVMIARLMALAGRPRNGRERGVYVLNLMKDLSPNLHDDLIQLWDTVIPKLIQYLEDPEKQENWSQRSWEDLLLKMLSKSLDVVDHEEWIAELGEAFGSHIPMYNRYPEEKNFLYKCIGVVIRKSTKKDFVNKMLDLIFSTVKHTDQTEREGCAVGLGFCATSHLDAVLTKLENVTKNDMTKKSGGLLSFMKDKSEADIERIKATLMLCYGFVALYSPPSLIISRMEATILRSLTPHFANVKDTSVKQNLIRTVDQIGQALHPSHLGTTYNFTNRGDFLTHMQTYMKLESTQSLTNETRALAINACTTLVKLDPIVSEADMFDLIKSSTDCLYPLPPEGETGGKKGKTETEDSKLEAEVLLEATFENLHDLLKELLKKDYTPGAFDNIFKHLVPWYLSLHEHERERALKTTQILLEFLLENMDSTHAQPFTNEHILLARLVPRCSDPSIIVRQISMDCIQATLQVAVRCEGSGPDHKDNMIEALPTLKDRLQKGDPNVLYSVVNDLSKVISKKLPADQLKSFVDLVQEGLVDPQSHSSSGACVVLNGVMKTRGAELLKEVENILGSLHEKLFQVQFDQTKTGALRTIRTLATHHLIPTIKCLLNYPLPYDENLIEIWKILSKDAQLTPIILEHMLELLQKSLPYEEKGGDGKESVRKATQVPLAITCALKEMFQVEETEEQVAKIYHRLFAALMVRMGASVGVEPLKKQEPLKRFFRPTETKDKKKSPPPSTGKQVKPSQAAVEAFRKFLENTKSVDIIEVLSEEDCWEKLEDKEDYPNAINVLTRALVNSTVGAQHVSKIVSCLTSVLSSLYDPQRIVVASFFAELVNQKCMGDDDLVELVMNSLLGRLVDTSHVVRQMCIRGLGNIASIGKAQVQQYSTTVLSAMMAGMDDREDPEDDITVEAMSGLSRVLTEIDESHIRAILINVALRIRPCFEKDKANVRAQAIILFGNLSAFGDGPSKQPFLEQIHSNFVSLLLHLNDPEDEVKKACKFTLRLVGGLIGSDAVKAMFQKLLLDDAKLHYGEFMNDLSKLVIQDFPEKVNFYVMGCVSFYKSSWSEIKSNAALFTGFLLGNLPEERQSVISKEHICAALIMLLKDSSPKVRSTAAEAMSLLQEY